MRGKAWTVGQEVHLGHSPTLFPSGLRMAVVGGASWLILLAGVLRGFFRLSIFDLLFLLAPWVMAPLGLNLVAAQADRLAQMNVLVVRYLLFPAAALALLRPS